MQGHPSISAYEALRWYEAMGIDETIGETPVDRYAVVPKPVRPPVDAKLAGTGQIARPPPPASSASLAQAAKTLDELKTALENYDGCALKKSCQRTVFADGNPAAKIMIIGEAPGADEDRLGLPFVGASGKLLDAMLAAIGLDRGSVYIANVVPWRPPGNRKPEPSEVELCLPFVTRQIELVGPELLVLLGGAAVSALMARTDSITRLRGQWLEFSSAGLARPIPAIATFHPAYLLRTPLHKREAWRDFLALQQKLASIS